MKFYLAGKIGRNDWRHAAARAWADGGTLGLGSWLARVRPRFTVRDYSEAVAAAREALEDDTDYSEGEHNHASTIKPYATCHPAPRDS